MTPCRAIESLHDYASASKTSNGSRTRVLQPLRAAAVAPYTMCLEVCDMPTINILTIISISPSQQRIGGAEEEAKGEPIRATALVQVFDSFDVMHL